MVMWQVALSVTNAHNNDLTTLVRVLVDFNYELKLFLPATADGKLKTSAVYIASEHSAVFTSFVWFKSFDLRHVSCQLTLLI